MPNSSFLIPNSSFLILHSNETPSGSQPPKSVSANPRRLGYSITIDTQSIKKFNHKTKKFYFSNSKINISILQTLNKLKSKHSLFLIPYSSFPTKNSTAKRYDSKPKPEITPTQAFDNNETRLSSSLA